MRQIQKIHRGRPERFSDLLFRFTGLSRDEVALLVRMGGAYVNELRCKEAEQTITEGTKISAYWREPLVLEEVPFDPNWLVHSDARWVIAAKPAGLPTQGRRDSDTTAFYELLKQYLGGYLALHHRLDEDTSGLMIFCRDKSLNQDIARIFNERLARKTYLAVCCGDWKQGHAAFTLDLPIAAHRDSNGTRQVIDPAGKSATTEIEWIASSGDLHLVSCRPKTGRTHQIRVHLAHLGLPLWGDALYGNHDRKGYFLHCCELAWPQTGKLAKGLWRLSVPEGWRQHLPDDLMSACSDWWRAPC